MPKKNPAKKKPVKKKPAKIKKRAEGKLENLGDDQRKFIEKKVKSLKTKKKVEDFYHRDDIVSGYARSYWKKLNDEKKAKTKKK